MRDVYAFDYLKESKGSTEIKKEKILVFSKDEEYLTGLKMEGMDPSDEAKLRSILTQLEEDLQPFVKKYFRKFLVKNIQGNPTKETLLKKI